MRRLLVLICVVAVPAAAEEPGPAPTPPLDLRANGGYAPDPILERIFNPAASPLARAKGDGGLIGGTLDTIDSLLEKLGVDGDELADALAEVEIVGAEENWRDESSGEVGLSFGVTDRWSVGPSFGLRYEEENLAGPDNAWSQQLKFGARYSF